MDKTCKTCWYGSIPSPVCSECLDSWSPMNNHPMWVSKNVFANVEELAVTEEENEVFVRMTQMLLEPKPTVLKEGVKYDSDKPRWELIPFRAMQEVVEVLTYGSKKYADNNWKIVPGARSRYISAAFRHFTASVDGEKNDPETGKSHLAHAVCCLLFLLWFEQEDKCPLKK